MDRHDELVSRAPKAARKAVQHLESHPEPYVTVGELAEYWSVSRKQIYKQIEAGTLNAIRLGPRLMRIRTADALEFEQRAKMAATPRLDERVPGKLARVADAPMRHRS